MINMLLLFLVAIGSVLYVFYYFYYKINNIYNDIDKLNINNKELFNKINDNVEKLHNKVVYGELSNEQEEMQRKYNNELPEQIKIQSVNEKKLDDEINELFEIDTNINIDEYKVEEDVPVSSCGKFKLKMPTN